VSAVVAVSFSTGFMQAEQSVDTNRNRASVAQLHGSIGPAFKQTCNNPNTRFTIAQFNDERTKLVPMVKASADAFDWTGDYKKFVSMLPKYRGERYPVKQGRAEQIQKMRQKYKFKGESGVAFAVYDLSVWADKQNGKFKSIPVFVTYMDQRADPASKYLGGSFMGSAALAASCTAVTASVTKSGQLKSYKSFCTSVAKQLLLQEKALYCKADKGSDKCKKKVASKEFHSLFCKNGECARTIEDKCSPKKMKCPFAFDNESSDICENKCSDVENWGTGALWRATGKSGKPMTCCKAIMKYCKSGTAKGCTKYQKAIYARDCDKNYVSKSYKNGPVVTLLGGMKEDEAKCLPICRNGCHRVKARKMMPFRACAKCATGEKKQKYKKWIGVAQCHMDAIGFDRQVCCGLSPACGSKKAKKYGRLSCNKAPFKKQKFGKINCEWTVAKLCPKVRKAQIAMKAALGCCAVTQKKKTVFLDKLHKKECKGKFSKSMSCKAVKAAAAKAAAEAKKKAADAKKAADKKAAAAKKKAPAKKL